MLHWRMLMVTVTLAHLPAVIARSLVEMYTLLQFVMPSVFSGDADSFIKMFDKPFDGTEGEDSATLNEEERLLLTTRLHEARSVACVVRVACVAPFRLT
jgi:hypothetical protein